VTARFIGKIAIVTGAAQGIGKAIALQLAQEGATLVLADMHEAPLESAASEARAIGGRVHTYCADLSQARGARGLVDYAIEHERHIDVAIHNVGGTIWSKPFWEYQESEIEQEIARSLWPTLWGCHAVIGHMRERRRGAIVNIGSVAARSIYRVPYAAAKSGVHAITACMALELEDCGVRINCVAPGGIDTGTRLVPRNPHPLSEAEIRYKQHMTQTTLANTPMRRYGRADEIAPAACFLASDEASYITGQVLYVAGGGVA
jgi:dihydroxycyclohexadiene carboxylate dehydrogenase